MNTSGALLAALGFDVGFRGILVVATGVVGLIGTVFLLLATNSGIRLGALITLTGLAGWMFLMGVVWSMYGIGDKGADPSWVPIEISFDTSQAELPVARQVPFADDLPTARVFLDEDPALAEQFKAQPRPPNLGDLLSVKPALDARINTSSWQLLANSDPQTGDATSVASNYLGPDGQNLCPSTSDCVVLNVFDFGGKPDRTDDSLVGRALHKLWGIVTFWDNPPHYSVVQVRKAIPQVTREGAPPPIPVADQDSEVISVIMERDLGTRRLPSVLMSVAMGILFLTLCYVLHRRDKLAARLRAQT